MTPPSLAARARAVLPAGVVRGLDRAISTVPDLRRPPAPLRPPEGRRRLLVAPANFAGQGWAWARAAERIDGVGARNMTYRGAAGFGFPSDYAVDTRTFLRSRAWQRSWFDTVASGFTHVLVEAELPVFGRMFRGDVVREVAALRDAGVHVAMVAHGSDVRLPSRHRANEPDSPFRPGGYEGTEQLERSVRRNLEVLERVAAPVLVSTPDLVADVPGGTWLPVVVAERWLAPQPAPLLADERPLVVHIPSRAGLKGSAAIEPALRRLDAEGVVRYERHEGVAADAMPDLYRRADVVLEQFAIGSYGVAACEALAAGRIVVGHVRDEVRDHVRREGGAGELPIVQSRASELERVLRDLVADRARARSIAAEGPRFVRAVHDGRRSAEVLATAFLDR
ncbi:MULTISPECIES: glycosyltransferase family protein [unclassified Agromyces]|uniref:glycosyltransferase family protein n=1 Tax=unclassified Agromyces TaxID=2639701 RepID=UPI0030144DEC